MLIDQQRVLEVMLDVYHSFLLHTIRKFAYVERLSLDKDDASNNFKFISSKGHKTVEMRTPQSHNSKVKYCQSSGSTLLFLIFSEYFNELTHFVSIEQKVHRSKLKSLDLYHD